MNEMLRSMVDKMFRVFDDDPETLLDHAGDPVGAEADVIVARLYGLDDELIDEIRLNNVRHILCLPIWRKPIFGPVTTCAMLSDLGVANYELQSMYVRGEMDSEISGVEASVPPFRTSVLCVRYRRALR